MKITDNIVDSNQLSGMTFVNSGENQITLNKEKGSVNGIFLDEQSSFNDLHNNTLTDNPKIDINNANGLPNNRSLA
jgi:hypothetical protein